MSRGRPQFETTNQVHRLHGACRISLETGRRLDLETEQELKQWFVDNITPRRLKPREVAAFVDQARVMGASTQLACNLIAQITVGPEPDTVERAEQRAIKAAVDFGMSNKALYAERKRSHEMSSARAIKQLKSGDGPYDDETRAEMISALEGTAEK